MSPGSRQRVRRFARLAGLPVALLLLVRCPPGEPWRSQLYPEDWQPGTHDAEGRILHDFSYAGYRNGEAPLPADPPGLVYDVVADFGADPQGAADSTSAVQQAIEAAGTAGGGVVFLPEGTYRVDGLLEVVQSGVVVRGEGPDRTRIFFTRAQGMTDKSHLVFRGTVVRGPDLPLALDGENESAVVYTGDASSLQVGDDVSVGWVITDEFVAEHGMTGTWQAFNGQWKPIFLRKVVAFDLVASPHAVTLDVPLRYPAKVRDGASLRRETGYVSECGIESLAVANAVDWQEAWGELRVHAVRIEGGKDCWVRDVRSFPTPYAPGTGYHLQSGGMKVLSSKRITIADCRLEKAQNRGEGGCGYLYEVSKSNEVLVRDSVGADGRHNFIQNWDFGTSGCVFLRSASSGGRCLNGPGDTVGIPCFCEFHHSLAMACLVDQSTFSDGWFGGNRGLWSSGAGHTVTQSVYWNAGGGGYLGSWQYGWGYVIGTQSLIVNTGGTNGLAAGTAPADWVEGVNAGALLTPASLYEDQLARRLAR